MRAQQSVVNDSGNTKVLYMFFCNYHTMLISKNGLIKMAHKYMNVLQKMSIACQTLDS